MHISNRIVAVSVVVLIALPVANYIFFPPANVADSVTSDTRSGSSQSHQNAPQDGQAANVSPAAPEAPVPRDPVRVRTNLPYVPGAIVCKDLNTVSLLVELYKEHFLESIQDNLTRGGSRLIQGDPSPEPGIENYGCSLARPGTILDRLNTFSGAVVVSGQGADGRPFRGVTAFYMVEDEQEQSQQPSNVIPNNNSPSQDGSSPSASVVGSPNETAENDEFPELENTADLDCSTDHRGCSPEEFAKVIEDIRKQWSRSPPWLRVACISNRTASGWEDCFINQTMKWQEAHPGEKPTWSLLP